MLGARLSRAGQHVYCFAFRACFKLTAAAHGFLRARLAVEMSEKWGRCAVFHYASNALMRIETGWGLVLENALVSVTFCGSVR